MLMTCLTAGRCATLSLPARAASAGLAPAPLGRSSLERESDWIGFCGMAGWTPSMPSQWAGRG
ncbi:hypothetical protein IMZ48_19745 [Candidatus Bathyarchaeota archaeon]|nr:hypothetical protein [Candidatus Bathyarchaeota archaeon]